MKIIPGDRTIPDGVQTMLSAYFVEYSEFSDSPASVKALTEVLTRTVADLVQVWSADTGRPHAEFSWDQITRAQVRALHLHWDARGMRRSTEVNYHMRLRVFSVWVQAEYGIKDVFQSVKHRRPTVTVQPAITVPEAARMLRDARKWRNPQRFEFVLMLLMGTGMRATELMSLTEESISYPEIRDPGPWTGEDHDADFRREGRKGAVRDCPAGRGEGVGGVPGW